MSGRATPRRLHAAPGRLWAVVLVALVTVAGLSRFRDLARPGMTYDELNDYSESLAFCEEPRLAQPISDGYLNGSLPFFAACPAYRALGTSEVTARALAAVAGLLAVFACFLLGRRLLGRRGGLLAALLLATSGFFLSASRLAFSHGHIFQVPLLLFGLVPLLGSRPARKGMWVRLGASGLLLGLAAGTDLLAALWLPGALLVWQLRRPAAALRARAVESAGLAAAWLGGLCLGSPMYAAHPLEALRDVLGRLSFWDAMPTFLWLGQERGSLPVNYYAVVSAIKLSPPLLVLLGFGVWAAVRRRSPGRLLLLLLWPCLYLSLKPWKQPFYLTAFLPLVCLLAALGLRSLWVGGSRRPRLAGALLAITLLAEVGLSLDVHPDHLMLGIRWGRWAYGGFSGPAVSHGQWVPAALAFVRADAVGTERLVIAADEAVPQLGFYAIRLGMQDELRTVSGTVGLDRTRVTHLLLSQETLKDEASRRINRRLLKLATGRGFAVARTFCVAGFPVAWAFRRVGSDDPPRSRAERRLSTRRPGEVDADWEPPGRCSPQRPAGAPGRLGTNEYAESREATAASIDPGLPGQAGRRFRH